MCDQVSITSQLLEITKTLAEQNVSFNISLNFSINEKDFSFNASSSKKDQDPPILLKKRKKSPSQKARNLKRWLEHKEKTQKTLENTTSPESPAKSSDVTLASKDDSVKPLLSCDQCKHTTKTENGIIKHKKNKHDIDQLEM